MDDAAVWVALGNRIPTPIAYTAVTPNPPT